MATMTEMMLELRPRNEGSDALRDAIKQTTAKLADLEQRKVSLSAELDSVLLTGAPAQVESIDLALAETTEAIRRAGIILRGMSARLDPTLAREAAEAAAIRQKRGEVGAEVETFLKDWRKHYPQHAGAIRDLLERGLKATKAAQEFHRLASGARDRENPLLEPGELGGWDDSTLFRGRRVIFDLVALPGVNGGPYTDPAERPFWTTEDMHRRLYSIRG